MGDTVVDATEKNPVALEGFKEVVGVLDMLQVGKDMKTALFQTLSTNLSIELKLFLFRRPHRGEPPQLRPLRQPHRGRRARVDRPLERGG